MRENAIMFTKFQYYKNNCNYIEGTKNIEVKKNKVYEIIEETIKRGTVKFKYQIKVTNEGEIEGYATEIKDYIPEGLKFVEKDNKKWKLSKDGKTVA